MKILKKKLTRILDEKLIRVISEIRVKKPHSAFSKTGTKWSISFFSKVSK